MLFLLHTIVDSKTANIQFCHIQFLFIYFYLCDENSYVVFVHFAGFRCTPLLPGPEKGVGGIGQKVRQMEHLEEAQEEAAVSQKDGEPSGHRSGVVVVGMGRVHVALDRGEEVGIAAVIGG